MIILDADQCHALRHWFEPETPGIGLAGPHVCNTGHGTWIADQWPAPRWILAQSGANYALRGDAAAFPVDQPPTIAGFVDAGSVFRPVLERAYDRVLIWPRVLFRLDGTPQPLTVITAGDLRRLAASDAHALAHLPPELRWISNTWGGPVALAASGYAWGVWVDGHLVSVACSFFVGHTCEEIGVVTADGYRGRGFSAACSAALCREIQARGRGAYWTTSTDNLASIRVAQKVGLAFVGEAEVYIVNGSIPE